MEDSGLFDSKFSVAIKWSTSLASISLVGGFVTSLLTENDGERTKDEQMKW